ncbi:hypothetical protein [Nostoc sp. T09]|nr:hypothetical protein [Nostoc sp. T09]
MQSTSVGSVCPTGTPTFGLSVYRPTICYYPLKVNSLGRAIAVSAIGNR